MPMYFPFVSKSEKFKKINNHLMFLFIIRSDLEMKDYLNPIWPCNLRIVFCSEKQKTVFRKSVTKVDYCYRKTNFS